MCKSVCLYTTHTLYRGWRVTLGIMYQVSLFVGFPPPSLCSSFPHSTLLTPVYTPLGFAPWSPHLFPSTLFSLVLTFVSEADLLPPRATLKSVLIAFYRLHFLALPCLLWPELPFPQHSWHRHYAPHLLEESLLVMFSSVSTTQHSLCPGTTSQKVLLRLPDLCLHLHGEHSLTNVS